MIGKLKGLSINNDGTQDIILTVNTDFREEYEELKEKDLKIDIKKYSRSRSLDANAYCWMIIDRIAEKTKLNKSDIYRNAIREIGGVSTIVCVKDIAADTLCKNWSEHGMGWMSEKTPSKIDGCTNVTLWYGSSVYNVTQMRDLISSLVQDAESLGISTITPAEQLRLLEQWNERYAKKAISA